MGIITPNLGMMGRGVNIFGGGGGGASDVLAFAINALSPIAFWKFDETSGTTVTDYAENGQDLTYTNTGSISLASVAGPKGTNHALFNSTSGTGYAVGAADTDLSLVLNSGISFVQMLYGTNLSGNLWGGLRKGNEYQFRGFSTTNMNWELEQTGSPKLGIGVSPTITQNEWFLAYGATGVDNTVRPTILGRNVDELTPYTNTGSGSGGGSAPNGITIGQIFLSPTLYYWRGAIAHTAIFPGVLTQSNFDSIISAAQADGWIA